MKKKLFAFAGKSVLSPEGLEKAVQPLVKALEARGISGGFEAVALECRPFTGALVAPGGDLDSFDAFLMITPNAQEDLDPEALRASGAEAGLENCIVLESHPHIPEGAAQPENAAVRIGLINRKPELSFAQFREHWLGNHVGLVMANAPLFFRYVTNPTMTESQWDGIVEQWFPDEETWTEHDRRILESRPDVRADIPKFVGGLAQYFAKPAAKLSVSAG